MTTENERNKPTHIVKVRHGTGRGAHYERIGVAWESPENASLYVKLHGTQIISGGFSIYPIDDDTNGGAR